MIGVNHKAYYTAYFLSDYIFYCMPLLINIFLLVIVDYQPFLAYSCIKTLNMFIFGFVLIALIYLIVFIFRNQEKAFKNSGVFIYILGFWVADALACIRGEYFYQVSSEKGSHWKLLFILNPFIYNEWTIGYAEKNTHGPEGDYNFNF